VLQHCQLYCYIHFTSLALTLIPAVQLTAVPHLVQSWLVS
jgi:hypothetical protein